MFDNAFNPKIAQLATKNNLPRTALLLVIMQASSDNLTDVSGQSNGPIFKGLSASRRKPDIKHLSIDNVPPTCFGIYMAIFREMPYKRVQ